MELDNSMSRYWLWKEQLPQNVCQTALQEVQETMFDEGTIFVDGKQVVDPAYRTGKVLFMKAGHWLETILATYGAWGNQSGKWNYSIYGCDNLQIAKYSPGEQYNWHTDCALLRIKDMPVRKLTIVLQLSKKEDFTGGGLFLEGDEESVLQNQGDIIVFPSFLMHKAAPVLSGTRYTAVLWMVGPAFS